MTTILIPLGLIVVLIGLLGTIYPVTLGLGLMFGGAQLLTYAGNYRVCGTNMLIFIGTAAAFGMAVDYVSGVLGAKHTGASKQVLWDAFISDITGVSFSLPGLLLGPLIGAGVDKFIAKRDMLQAGRAGLGTLIGFITGTIAKADYALAIVLTPLSVWIFNLST